MKGGGVGAYTRKSDKTSAYAALISSTSERDRAKYVEQFDDILRTFINETNKFENRFGTIRDEEKMLAVKKLMLESLLNCRFRETTMSYSELLIAVETSSLTRQRQSRQPETGRLTRVFRWRLEWRRKMTVKVREKKEIKEL